LIRSAALLSLWERGFVEPVVPPPEPLHILAQQLMGLALQERGVTHASWKPPLEVFLTQAGLSEADGAALIESLVAGDVFTEDGEVLWFGERGERRFGRRHFMELLAVFASEPLLTVRYGRLEIGSVHPITITSNAKEHPLTLGGRSWQIVDVDWDRKQIQVTPGTGRGKARWIGDSAPLGFELCQECRAVLTAKEPSARWSSRARRRMEELRSDHDFLRPGATTLLFRETATTWWTFAGLLANAQIAGWLQQRFDVEARPSNLTLELQAPVDAERLRAELRHLGDAFAFEFTPNEELADRLKFRECLPGEFLARVLRARYAAAEQVRETLGAPVRWHRAS
jgi:ATP-dependent Lhr-like helicase